MQAISTRTTVLLLLAAVLANGAAGLLYVWSLFILPIEAALNLTRGDLGIIASLSLICFTAGVSVMPLVMGRIGRTGVAVLAFALIGGGHLMFAAGQGWVSLATGYGIGFGFGSGLAYGLALSLAATLPARIRAAAIGFAMAAFALSGIVLPLVLGDWIAARSPAHAFLWIGSITLVIGVVCTALLSVIGASPTTDDEDAEPNLTPPRVDRPLLILSAIFFLICFTGLVVISQAAAIAADAGLSASGYATTALTLGYLAGSLLGAPLAERIGERRILLTLGVTTLAGTFGLMSGGGLLLPGAALVGLTFGGSGSIMPTLLGLRYGAAHISRLYGQMIIAYGIAGLVAPGTAGLLYSHSESYLPTLVLCAVFAGLAILAALLLETKDSGK